MNPGYLTFDKLKERDRRDYFDAAAERMGTIQQATEKDLWVCRVIDAMFDGLSTRPKLYFKGGTSLSKGYGLIKRFSEDIDIVISRSGLGVKDDGDPLAEGLTRRQRDARLEAVKTTCSAHEGGYRAQIAAYSCARLARLGTDESNGGSLDYIRIWSQQAAGELLERQIAAIAEVMAKVLRNPPLAGRNISEWAKQQACRKTALDAPVPVARGFDAFTVSPELKSASRREQKTAGSIDRGLDAVKTVMSNDARYWEGLRQFARLKRLLSPEDEKCLVPACSMPAMIPTDRQAVRLLQLAERAAAVGWKHS